MGRGRTKFRSWANVSGAALSVSAENRAACPDSMVCPDWARAHQKLPAQVCCRQTCLPVRPELFDDRSGRCNSSAAKQNNKLLRCKLRKGPNNVVRAASMQRFNHGAFACFPALIPIMALALTIDRVATKNNGRPAAEGLSFQPMLRAN